MQLSLNMMNLMSWYKTEHAQQDRGRLGSNNELDLHVDHLKRNKKNPDKTIQWSS